MINTKLNNAVRSLDKNKSDKSFFCGAGNSYVFIKSNGNVALCPTMPEDFYGGNLKEKSLKEIWENSIFFNRMRNINCKYISQCSISHICKGGCRSRSILLYKSLETPDLQMCKLMYKLTGMLSPPLKNTTD